MRVEGTTVVFRGAELVSVIKGSGLVVVHSMGSMLFPCLQMRMTGDVVGGLLPASGKLVLASGCSCKRVE